MLEHVAHEFGHERSKSARREGARTGCALCVVPLPDRRCLRVKEVAHTGFTRCRGQKGCMEPESTSFMFHVQARATNQVPVRRQPTADPPALGLG